VNLFSFFSFLFSSFFVFSQMFTFNPHRMVDSVAGFVPVAIELSKDKEKELVVLQAAAASHFFRQSGAAFGYESDRAAYYRTQSEVSATLPLIETKLKQLLDSGASDKEVAPCHFFSTSSPYFLSP